MWVVREMVIRQTPLLSSSFHLSLNEQEDKIIVSLLPPPPSHNHNHPLFLLPTLARVLVCGRDELGELLRRKEELTEELVDQLTSSITLSEVEECCHGLTQPMREAVQEVGEKIDGEEETKGEEEEEEEEEEGGGILGREWIKSTISHLLSDYNQILDLSTLFNQPEEGGEEKKGNM